MATKRALHQDPEYEAIPAELQEKRIKLMEDSVRKQTKKKIENIVKTNFDQEKNSKDAELDALDEALYECRSTLDRLRACAVTHYYANLGSEQASAENSAPSVHPTVKKYLGKTPRHSNCTSFSNESSRDTTSDNSTAVSCKISSSNPVSNQDANKRVAAKSTYMSPSKDVSSRAPRFKTKSKIVIGNISKFIPVWQRDESDQSTHKWMIYVRGGRHNSNIESFVSKVRFLLHPSYRPTDIVEICNPPFHLVKRGWGEFPVRVQLHFYDSRNKPVDIIHNLKLDKTYTGLQTLGAETVVELQLFKSDSNGALSSPFTPSSPASNFPSTSTNSVRRKSTTETNFNSFPISIRMDFGSEGSNESSKVKPLSACVKTNEDENGKSVNTEVSSKKSSGVINGIITPKKDFRNLMLSNSGASEAKPPPPKKNTTLNGVNTTYLKCTDNEGRLLLVPQSSLLQIKSGAKTNLTNTDLNAVNDKNVNKKATVPSYILKVVPNQESGQNQVLLIKMAEKRCTEINLESSGNKTNSLAADKNHVIEVPFKKPKCDQWQEEVSNIKLENYKSFVDLLKRVCKIFSLVKGGIDRSTYPFCANSLEDFHRWNIGKQRAAEWRRAGLVHTTILNLLKKHNTKCFSSENVWPRHRIMSWCRRNGFVPMTSEKMSLLPEPQWSGVELCSVSNANGLISTMSEEANPTLGSNSVDNEEIEIVEDTHGKSTVVKPKIQNQPPSTHLPPLNQASAFVKETAAQIGIDIKPVELEPSQYVPAIEEIILAACRELATELIQSSVNAGYNRLGGQFCPEEVTVSDVYSAIKENSKFDFLNNSYLGVPKEDKEGT